MLLSTVSGSFLIQPGVVYIFIYEIQVQV